jgi:hypothetical protein
MLTSKVAQPSAEWYYGFDAGFEQAPAQLRAALLDKLETLEGDVRLGLRQWSLQSLLEEVFAMLSDMDIASATERVRAF